MPDSEIFFAYPSEPQLAREMLTTAARRLDRVGGLRARCWEDLHVGGRIVIQQILSEIDRTSAGVYDITSLNPNVLFELGYAVGREKHVFPLLDESLADASKRWSDVRILSGIGYTPYKNSDDIFVALMREQPHLREKSIWEEAIAPGLFPAGIPSLFYVTSLHGDDASGALTRTVRAATAAGIRISTADPRETAVQPLTWYAQQIYDAAAAVIHFESPRKLGADLHNARCALIAGISHGTGRPILMLAAEDYSAPFDYRDLLFVYSTAGECASRAEYWLTRELEPTRLYVASVAAEETRRKLSTELRTLRLGEPVAENEAADLEDYFIDTAVYHEVLADTTAVYVGRRGTGKTATMLAAGRSLSDDRRNVVCTITPSDYQIEGLSRLLRTYSERDTRGYVIEAIWKFLLYSEIALAAVRDIKTRPAGLQPNAPEWELNAFLDGPGADLKVDFDVRLERAIARLEKVPHGGGIEEERGKIVEALHRGHLADLRGLLERALGSNRRVAVLIDNLDRAWDARADLSHLAYLLLGLLSSVPSIIDDLRRGGSRHQSIPISAAVFIRTDIYAQLIATALEPDKLPVRRLLWDDPVRLLEIVEARYAASVGNDAVGGELWRRFFCQDVGGLDVKDYVLARILPRPRDMLVYIRAAIEEAVLRRSPIVDAEHIYKADEVYSQFAFDALKIEDPVLGGRLDDAFIEFAGGPNTWSTTELTELLDRVGLQPDEHSAALNQMRDVSFLGIETSEGDFDFSDDVQAQRRADVMSRRYALENNVETRYQVHSAFRPYLEIPDRARQ
jgi:hypothetical protein